MMKHGYHVDYVPQSSFGWLDADDAAAERMREVLKAFDEKDTIDALGFGVVRDALANTMFPGTSTIQTRARYFFFVPWIYQQCERLALPPRELDAKVRELEIVLIESLRAGVDRIRDAGIIGGRARKNTKRLASSVYWNGLATLGFRLADVSPSDLRRLIPALRSRAQAHRDDNGETIGASQRLWGNLPGAPEGFPHQPLTFDLTKEEATCLAEAMQLHARETLLARLAATPEVAARCSMPWEVPERILSPQLREVVRHARLFSEVTHGANLLYNVMLCDAATRAGFNPENADRDALSDALEQWEGRMRAQRDEIRGWAADLAAFWRIVEQDAPVSDRRTRPFVEWWVKTVAEDSSAPRRDESIRDAIEQRERRIKSPPRLTNRRALERWNGAAFGQAQFAFRFPTVKRFMADLAAGLGRT